MAKKEEKKIERTYNVPLRKEFRKVPRWRKTKKAVRALKEFLAKHMKSDNVKLSKEINEQLWKHGIKNPPHHIKVNVTKDSEGKVEAELFGVKKEGKVEKKAEVKKEEKEAPAKETEKKEETKTEEKPVEKKEEKDKDN